MKNQNKIKLFQDKKVRTIWSEDEEQWYFSIVDAILVLTNQETYQSARNYWKVLKHRLAKEGNETVTNCNCLKLEAKTGKKVVTKLNAKKFLIK